MKRRIQRRPYSGKVYLQQAQSHKTIYQSLTELLGVIAAGTSLFAVLLYLAGRSFASGYFEAMNIPSYQVSFSLWEYGEAGWVPLLLYPVIMLILSGYFSGVLRSIREWLFAYFIGNAIKNLRNWFYNWLSKVKWIQDILAWLKSRVRFRLPVIQPPSLSKETLFYFKAAKFGMTLLYFLLFLLVTLYVVRLYGKWSGQLTVLDKASQVEITSMTPMVFDENQSTLAQANNQNYYTYKGFYLLTFNNEKYYLFKEIDQESCKPIKVYIVEKQENLQVSYLPAVSLRNKCKP